MSWIEAPTYLPLTSHEREDSDAMSDFGTDMNVKNHAVLHELSYSWGAACSDAFIALLETVDTFGRVRCGYYAARTVSEARRRERGFALTTMLTSRPRTFRNRINRSVENPSRRPFWRAETFG